MIHWMRERLGNDERGFTLIELMVVVLIIAILIAIAIPTFLGARERAQDRAAQSDLRNALTAEKVYYTDNEAYTAGTASLIAIEPSLSWNAGFAAGTSDSGETFVAVGNVTTGTTAADNVTCLSQRSASGTIFWLKDVAVGTNAGTWYGTAALTACDDSQGATSW